MYIEADWNYYICRYEWYKVTVINILGERGSDVEAS